MWVLVVICWLPMFLQAAPVVLPPNWTMLNSDVQVDQMAIFSPDNGYRFGFLKSNEGLATLAIAISPCNPNAQPECKLYSPDLQVVWSANRNSLVGSNATLSLSDGNLVLRDNDTRQVWSTDLPPGESITSIEMQRDGNLVLRDAVGKTLWESFNYPTDTLVPGQKLGYKMALVAGYRMVMESKALVLYTTLGSPSVPQPYWIFPQLTLDEIIHSEGNSTIAQIEGNNVSNIHICNDKICSKHYFGGFNGNTINFLRLDYDGVLRWYYNYETFDINGFVRIQWTQLTMTNDLTNPCLYPAYCGPYGICSSGGYCTCPSGAAPGLLVQNVTYFSNKYLPPTTVNGSSADCRNMCLQNCFCAAAFWNSGKCVLIQELQSLYTISDSNDEYVAFIKYARKTDGTSEWNLKLGLSISSGVLGLLLMLVCMCIVVVVIRARSLRCAELDDAAFLKSLRGVPPRFTVKEMNLATDHFTMILGKGGFGTVFKGILPDGTKVAVKRLGGSRQGHREFWAEVATIGGINHLRLVRLCGFCCEGTHRMLVYECMDNGSLDRWLFRDSILLAWPVRYQVAVDVAQGLSYLHRDCSHSIIHLDVKPQNILLDNQFRAKVADFGMSKIFHEEMTEVVTRMRGTPGYLAPEWLLQTGITVKCDVYSYGMVLLEMVSGRKNMDVNASLEKWYFPAWAVQKMEENSWIDIVDFRLAKSLTVEDWAQAKKMVKIALWCIQDSPQLRPTMTMVVQMLEGVVKVHDPPLQFDFLALCSRGPPIHSLSKGSTDELPSPEVVDFESRS
ncbi:hypothetical protein M758_9G054700 [Ceratodon purpureus]|nr:hypothetical protein M758_9G054700 [Ceratodon purpureus]